ncbi:MAG: DUF3916 domain-containing protein [Hyphomonadaceae bacterium]
MRRLDLHPDKKLRNAQRHLRRLAQWPEWIVEGLPAPEEYLGRRFLNLKIPVFAKVSDPPHATVETQRACIAAILAAARAIETSPLRPRDCRVACLVGTPSLFQSEVTLFFDEDYFRSFLPPEDDGKRNYFDDGWVEAEPADAEMIREITPDTPQGLEFFGGTLVRQYDPSWGRKPVEQATWVWAYPRR